MSDYRRPRLPGATIFFTVCLRQPGSDLLIREIDLLRASVGRTLRNRPVQVMAWTVLPDHMHCIWTLPPGDCDFSTRWRLIKARFSRGVPKPNLRRSHALRRERGIWQRRFWEHHIRSPDDLQAHMMHCWQAPVRLGLVSAPLDWAYSSFAKRKGQWAA